MPAHVEAESRRPKGVGEEDSGYDGEGEGLALVDGGNVPDRPLWATVRGPATGGAASSAVIRSVQVTGDFSAGGVADGVGHEIGRK